MTNLNNILFIDRFPKLDLHGYDRDTARVAIMDFINDQIKMRNNIIVIVHGIGSGILRNVTNDTLRSHKKVIDYKSYYNNSGCTVALLKIDF